MAGSGLAGGGHGRRSLFEVETGRASATAREMTGTFWSIAGAAVAMGDTFELGPTATSSANALQIATLTIAINTARRGLRNGCIAPLEALLPSVPIQDNPRATCPLLCLRSRSISSQWRLNFVLARAPE